jgi:hypothetical protein
MLANETGLSISGARPRASDAMRSSSRNPLRDLRSRLGKSCAT